MLRAATDSDVPSIARLVTAAYTPYIARIGRPPAPMTADFAALVAAGDAYVLLDGAAVTGVLVAVVQPDHVHVESVAVAPAAQGRGHGRTLLAFAEELATRRGLSQTRLYTNAAMTENLALYPRLGYVEVDRRHEDGFDRVYFVKDLGR